MFIQVKKWKRNIESNKDPRMYTENRWNEKKRISIQSDAIPLYEYLYTLYASVDFSVLNEYEIISWEKKISATVCHTCWIH